MVAHGRIKKYVFEHLDEHPKTSRKGIIKVFRRFNPTTVARYRLEWLDKRKGNGIFREGVKMLLKIMETKMKPLRELNKDERKLITQLVELINE